MKLWFWAFLACLVFSLTFPAFGQEQAENPVPASPTPAANETSKEDLKKAKEDAEKKAKAEVKAKADAEKKAAREAELKAKEEKKAKEAAEKKAAAEAKARIDAQKKEAQLKEQEQKKAAEAAAKQARTEAKTRKEAEQKAAAQAKAQKEAQEKAALEAADKAKAEARARAEAAKQAAKAAELQAREEQKAKEIIARRAAEAEKAKIAAEQKAERAADLRIKEEISAKEQMADVAKSEAKRKASEAEKAAKASQKLAADKKASPADKQKTQDEANLKQIAAKDAAAIASSRETEYIKAVKDFDALKQERILAKQKAEAEAKTRKEAEKKTAIEAKINAQEEARAKNTETAAKTGEPSPATELTVGDRIRRSFENAAKPEEAGKWKLSGGVMLRTIHSQTFKTYSYSENYNIAAKASDVARRYEPAGDLNSYSDRNYDNGYVHKDDFTDLDGGTANWGGGQAQGNSVSFDYVGRTYTDYSRDRESSLGETHNGFDKEIAPYFQLERTLYRYHWLDAGLHLDYYWTRFSDGAEYENFSDRQSWQTYAQHDQDTYNIGNNNVINNIPDARRGAGTVQTGSSSYNAYNEIQQSLDMNLNVLSFGPMVSANWWRLSLSGSTGPTFNFINMQTYYNEVLYASQNNAAPQVLQSWTDSQDYSECKFGYFVQANIGLRIIDGFGVGIFGRYDWVENMSGSVGQSRYVINPEGGSVGALANLSF